MKRRRFIGYSVAGGALALGAGTLWAQRSTGGHGHGHGHGHGAAEPAAPSVASPQQGAPLRALPKVANLASQPGHFQAQLAAAPAAFSLATARPAQLWLYNGQVAPLIEVASGDRVEVAVRNELNAPTTVHWHGLTVPHRHDGGPWHPIAPQAERIYAFQVDPASEGLHWFHPHPHGGTAQQIAHGLAGALLVRAADSPIPDTVEEHVLFVSDLRLAADGRVTPHTASDWMNGREGDLLLVNGQAQPKLEVAPGTTLRLRVVNACAGRYLNLQLEDHEWQMIGTDGGLLERPQAVAAVMLTPGERVDLLVRISEQPGRAFVLASHPYERGWMGPTPPHWGQVAPMLTLATRAEAPRPPVSLPSRLRAMVALEAPAVYRKIELTEVMPGGADHGSHGSHGGHGGHGGGHGSHPNPGDHASHGAMGQRSPQAQAAMAMSLERPPVEFLINGRSFTMDDVMFEGQVGQVEEWEVFNNSHMDHPFHVHGTRFQVVAAQPGGASWVPAPYLAWKDTVNLRPYERLRLRLVFAAPGDWLFHCHIIEHEEMGMMATVRIHPEPAA